MIPVLIFLKYLHNFLSWVVSVMWWILENIAIDFINETEYIEVYMYILLKYIPYTSTVMMACHIVYFVYCELVERCCISDWVIDRLSVCVKGVVVEKDGAKKTSVLTADAVELGRRMLDLSCVIASNVCIIHTTIHYTTEYYV